MDDSHFNGPLARLFIRHTPDPWSPEIDAAVRSKEAVPLCLDCLCPLETRPWFCPHCGFPVGDCVTCMPYLHIFPMAEVLRRGVMGRPDAGPVKTFGFLVYSTAQYSVFAPVYWFWMFRKRIGRPICEVQRKDLEFEFEEP